jgi:hypothetical protein
MALFHETLNDAIKDLKKGDVGRAEEILKGHRDIELKEEKYVDSSLFALKLYLENYIHHLTKALQDLSGEKLTDELKKEAILNIEKCKENSKAFQSGINELLKREGELD